MEQCEVLGRISEEPDLLVRPYGSEAMRRANDKVASWMRDAGMIVRRDIIGNLVGRYEGTEEGTFVLGSHLDTVRDAGKYDGPLVGLMAMPCAERLHAPRQTLPFGVEAGAFADEAYAHAALALNGRDDADRQVEPFKHRPLLYVDLAVAE